MGHPLNFLVDTGSTINLIKPNILSPETRSFIPPLTIRTINADEPIHHKYSTTCDDIDPDILIDFYEHDFSDQYHGLLGIPFLKTFNAQIDLPNHNIQLKGQTFTLSQNPFKVLFPHGFLVDAFVNTISFQDNLFRLDHLNSEEKTTLKNALKKFDDVFYHENDSLTFTNQIKHKIRTKHEDPIYTKSYRYPVKYKNEVDKQIKEMLDQL